MPHPSKSSNSPSIASSSSRVYLSYDIRNPPPHPGDSWTRFVCISDTHSSRFVVPPGDVLLHSGDLSSWGYFPQLSKTVNWLKGLPHPVKIIIAGNHDLCLDNDWRPGGYWDKHSREFVPNKDVDSGQALVRDEATRAAGIQYLEYESIRISLPNGRTWEIYGSPAAPRYAHGAFQYIRESREGKKIYDRIPPTTEILLTHTPPNRTCDLTKKGRYAGCKLLAAKMESNDLQNCRLHVFGHIHEAWGASLRKRGEGVEGTISVNAAVFYDEPPIIVDLLN